MEDAVKWRGCGDGYARAGDGGAAGECGWGAQDKTGPRCPMGVALRPLSGAAPDKALLAHPPSSGRDALSLLGP